MFRVGEVGKLKGPSFFAFTIGIVTAGTKQWEAKLKI